MPVQNEHPVSHRDKKSAAPYCVYCERCNCHEPWCTTQNASVQYAYQAVSQADLLNLGDQLILHALGVAWVVNPFLESRRTCS